VVDGVEGELEGGAFWRADEEVVAEVGLGEEVLAFAAEDEDGDGQRDAEEDGEGGQPGGEGALTHLLEDDLEEVH
jgi:hypothetical protein